MFWHRHHPIDNVSVVIGVVENPDSLLDIAAHIFVGTTIDGGFSEWLPSFDGKSLPRWETREGTHLLEPGWKGSRDEDLTPDTLRARCKCEAVDFLIKRPREPEEAGESRAVVMR